MKHFSKSFVIFNMEATRFFQNKRIVITTFLLGPLMVFFMMYIINSIPAGDSRVEVYGADTFLEILEGDTVDRENVCFIKDSADYSETILEEKNVVVVSVLQDRIDVVYDSSLLTDTSVLTTACELANQIAALMINENEYSFYMESLELVHSVDIGSVEDYIEFVLIPFVSVVFIIALMFANMSVSSLSLDAIAGEREQGIFDILRLSGTKTSSLIAGKCCFSVLVGIVLLVLETFALILGLYRYQPELYQLASAKAKENPAWFLPILVCLCSIVILSAALYIALSASFEKVSHASAYAGIIQIILSLFTYAPNVIGGNAFKYLPISNLWIVLQNTLTGKETFHYIVCSLMVVVVIASLALCYAKVTLEKELKR